MFCLKSALQFAVAAKAARGSRRFTGTQAVLATDLEAFRNSLFATGEVGSGSGEATMQQSIVSGNSTWSPNAEYGGWWNCGKGTWMPAYGHNDNAEGCVQLEDSLAFVLKDEDFAQKSCTSNVVAAGHGVGIAELQKDNEAGTCGRLADEGSKSPRSEQPEWFESSCVEALETGSHVMLGQATGNVNSVQGTECLAAVSAEANNEASFGAPLSGMLPVGGQAKFVQLREVAALCAVRPKHRAFFRWWLAGELHRKHKDRQSYAHGFSLSDSESNLATLMLRLSQPLQQARGVQRLSSDVTSKAIAAETCNDNEAKPEVSKNVSGTDHNAAKSAMDANEGANSFSLFAHPPYA